MGAVRDVLGETGAIGATVRQIASRLEGRPELIAAVLDRLRRRGDVLRMGRGLFVLRDFERLQERDDFVDPDAFVERFAKEDGVQLGRYAGPITFRSNETLPVHRWWPYVQGYSAELWRGSSRTPPFRGVRRCSTRSPGVEPPSSRPVAPGLGRGVPNSWPLPRSPRG